MTPLKYLTLTEKQASHPPSLGQQAESNNPLVKPCKAMDFLLPEPGFIPLEANADLIIMSALCG